MLPSAIELLLDKALMEPDKQKRDKIYQQVEDDIQRDINEAKERIARAEELFVYTKLLMGRE